MHTHTFGIWLSHPLFPLPQHLPPEVDPISLSQHFSLLPGSSDLVQEGSREPVDSGFLRIKAASTPLGAWSIGELGMGGQLEQ